MSKAGSEHNPFHKTDDFVKTFHQFKHYHK